LAKRVRDTIVCLAVLGVHLRFFITALGGVLIEMCRKLALELEHRLGISEKRWQLRCLSECLKKSDKPESVHQGFLKFEGLGHSEQTMFTVMLKEMGHLYLIHHSVFFFHIFVGALQKMCMEAKRGKLREGSMLSVQLTNVKNLKRHINSVRKLFSNEVEGVETPSQGYESSSWSRQLEERTTVTVNNMYMAILVLGKRLFDVDEEKEYIEKMPSTSAFLRLCTQSGRAS